MQDDSTLEANARTVARAGETLAELLERPLAAGLYLVATPIGNLADISLRALAVLARAPLVAAEDTRHSRKLLSHYNIHAELTPYQFMGGYAHAACDRSRDHKFGTPQGIERLLEKP